MISTFFEGHNEVSSETKLDEAAGQKEGQDHDGLCEMDRGSWSEHKADQGSLLEAVIRNGYTLGHAAPELYFFLFSTRCYSPPVLSAWQARKVQGWVE